MFRSLTIGAVCTALLSAACAGAGGETAPEPVDAGTVLSDAAAAMGTANLESITYSGSAWTIRNGFMQTPNASPPWPARNEITNYQRTIDLNGPASRATGETFAQDMFLNPATAGTYNQMITAQQTNWAQQLEIWLTPWGFLRGAAMHNAEAVSGTMDGQRYTVITWMSPETQTSPAGVRYTVRGQLDDGNLVEWVETAIQDPIWGDLPVVNRYSEYRDFGGVMVPTQIVQERGGGAVFGVTVADATANPPDLMALMTPPAPAGGAGPGRGGGGGRGGGAPGGAPAAPPDPASLVERIADGVYVVGPPNAYAALVTEFSDHLAVFEGGQNENRGEQIIEALRAAIPNKPIRYIINSHPHSDHTSGVAPFLREGAILITHENNVDYLRRAFSNPRTLLGQETLNPQVEGAGTLRVLEDDTMRLELHHIPNTHQDGSLVAYVPSARILFQADFSLPAAGQEANPFVVSLAEAVDRLGLDFDRYLAVHVANQPQTKADLMAALPR